MMTMNHYTNSADKAKTAEIMSRFRPIAPKPASANSMSESPRIRQSPYLRTLWPQLQARPTRTRKRGRTAFSPPPSTLFKRPRTYALGSVFTPCPSELCFQPFPCLQTLPQNFTPKMETTSSNLVTLPLLPCVPEMETCREVKKIIDLNEMADAPEEKDLLLQLQVPRASNIVAPQPVRPVGSVITVSCITQKPQPKKTERTEQLEAQKRVPKSKKQVLAELEAETYPAVITDSNNKLKIANSAYNEMVGQPECLWLDSMVRNDACKRICGTVVVHFLENETVPVDSNGFSCWVKIDWGSGGVGQMKTTNAFCEVVKLACESVDYLFLWRFHTHMTRESSSLSSYLKMNV